MTSSVPSTWHVRVISGKGAVQAHMNLLALAQPFLSLLARVGALLTVAVVLELALMWLTRLPAEGYELVVLVGALVDRILSSAPGSILAPLLLGAVAAAALRHRSLGPRWSDIDQSRGIRSLSILAAVLLTWIYTTFSYNLYFDQGYVFDRLLLLGLLALTIWRPIFILSFLVVLLPVLWQFDEPIGGFSWAAPMLLIRFLILTAALCLARLFTHRLTTADLVFLLCCLVAAHYWVSGVGKLRLGWFGSDQVAFLLPATYANGWLAFLGPDTIAKLTGAIASLNWPIKLATLLVECGALFALWRPLALRAFLAAAIGMHAAIFLVTGIFFWTWMLLNVAILVLFLGRRGEIPVIFTPHHFLLSLILIGGGAIWFRPAKLAWLDSRASYTYRLEAQGESGRTYRLPPRFFSPYDYQFTLGNFRYLTSTPHLRITWGATPQRDLAEALARSTSPEQVFALEDTMGQNAFNAERSAAFDEFVRRFVGQWNERAGSRGWWTRLQPPPLLWTFQQGPSPTPADPIIRVDVYQVTSFFDDARYLEIRTRPVRTVHVPLQTRWLPPGTGTD